MLFNAEEFYPTPVELLDKITAGMDWKKIHSVLEPSAGKGNIAEYVEKSVKTGSRRYYEVDIDCIEINKDLKSTLKGKGFKVVHDDFLTFQTFKKYDLIIMNPPFSSGAAHLMKALEMQKNGGAVICILNAETIRNPYSNERKALVKKLDDLEADIQYMEGAFTSSEHPTGVEIAVIKVLIPDTEYKSYIYESLKKTHYPETDFTESTDLTLNDFIRAAVARYNLEVESGIRLMNEYKAMSPYILSDVKECSYSRPILTMRIDGKDDLSVNRYVKAIRYKYWYALFNNKKFTGNMTSNLADKYYQQVQELSEYDFSFYNIKCIQEEMSRNLIQGIEDCIVALFDELSHQYSYSDELKNNIHYYNGWKTNKAWYINRKVILPYMNAFSSYDGEFRPDYRIKNKLMDIEKALNYLDGGLTKCRDMETWLDYAMKTGQTKKIQLKYFMVTFYKKGTCHIEFTNTKLLKKLNIFGSQQKKWLPPGYGKKTYQEMDIEERAVIDSFEGMESYKKTLANPSFYLYEPKSSLPAIEMTSGKENY